MDDTLLYILIFVAGGVVGYKINEMLMRFIFGKMIEEAGLTYKDLNKFTDHWRGKLVEEGMIEDDELTDVEIRIEQHNDQLYAYAIKGNEFIAQGKTKEELIAAIEKRMSNVKLIISQEHGAEFMK